jgi:hypothetical protein
MMGRASEPSKILDFRQITLFGFNLDVHDALSQEFPRTVGPTSQSITQLTGANLSFSGVEPAVCAELTAQAAQLPVANGSHVRFVLVTKSIC